MRYAISVGRTSLKNVIYDYQWLFSIGLMPLIYVFSVLYMSPQAIKQETMWQISLGSLGMGMWNATIQISSFQLRKDEVQGLMPAQFRSPMGLKKLVFFRSMANNLLGIVPFLINVLIICVTEHFVIVRYTSIESLCIVLISFLAGIVFLSISMAVTGTLLALLFMSFDGFNALASVISRIGLIFGGMFLPESDAIPALKIIGNLFLPSYGMRVIRECFFGTFNLNIYYVLQFSSLLVGYIVIIQYLGSLLNKSLSSGKVI